MKLYLLKQTDNDDWDTYDSCLVCAENEEDARTIAPNGKVFKENETLGIWAKSAESITCEEIGEANDKQERGVIIASFNAS
jgi:hypothetical protein